MPRTALSQDQVDAFREALCDAATRLFARQGYAGVTMRALAKDLGCSPMTPYRYFENKAAIFDTVRMAAANRFADAIADAAKAHDEHADRLRAMTYAYVRFAVEEPHAYRILFELDRKERPPTTVAEEARGWFVMRDAVAEAIADGALEGDPDVVAHLLWAGVHGLAALHLSGMLGFGADLETLVDAYVDRELARMTG